MASPSPPILTNQTIRPKANDSSLEFWWGYPSSIGGSAVTNYTLSCTDPPYSQTVGPSTFYTRVNSLTNGSEYSFQISATNSNGESAPASYRTVAPGTKPSVVQNVSTTVISTGMVQIAWDAPASDGGAAIGWYVVKPVSSSNTDPNEYTSAYTTERSTIISTLNTASVYRFNVHAVNDPGYSPVVSTPTVAPIFGDRYSYVEVLEPDGAQNYACRIYNSQSGWSGLIDLGYTINDLDGQYTSSNYSLDYDYAGTPNTFYTGFHSRYDNPVTEYGDYRFDFRTLTGSFLRSIIVSDNNNYYDLPMTYGESNCAFFADSNDGTNTFNLQLYQPNVNLYQSTVITVVGGVDSLETFTNGAYFFMYNDDTGLYDQYIWNIYSSTPTLFASVHEYYYERLYGNPKGIFSINRLNSTDYYDTINFVSETGFVSTATLPYSTYTNINNNNYYGVNGDHVYIRMYNINTSLYDIYVYNKLPSLTSIILSNLGGSGYDINIDSNANYGEDYNQTYDSDVFVVTNTSNTNNFGVGTGYAIFGSNSTVVSTVFTNTNCNANYLTQINSNSVCFIEQENTQVTAHFLRRTGEVSTILSSANAFYSNYQNNYTDYTNFQDLFFYTLPDPNTSNAFYYIFSNGQIRSSTIGYVYPYYEFSGKNGIVGYNSTLTVVQNGRFVSTITLQSNINYILQEYPNFATGNTVAYSYYNAGSTDIVTVTNSSILMSTTSFFTSNVNSAFLQSFLILYQSYPFQVLAQDMAGHRYGFSTIGTTYNNGTSIQSNSVGFLNYNDDTNIQSYLIFDFATSTFTTRSDASGDSENYFFTTDPYNYD